MFASDPPPSDGPSPDRSALASALKREALRLGFSDVGIVHPQPTGHGGALKRWLEHGHQAGMAFMAREDAVDRRLSGNGGWTRTRSLVVVAHDYYQKDPPGIPEDSSKGVIARYARGWDYHKVVHTRLRALLRWVRSEVGEDVWGRAYVDTGPLLERELGQRAGLGWFGRNTMLIHPRRGSYFFLGVLLLDLELPTDPPFAFDHCGSCRACLDACPTDALLGRDETGAPVLDANRCISYLTIEHGGAIPEELREGMGNRVYGCDICQECCPWTVKFGPETKADPAYAAMAWPADRDGDPPLPSLDGPDLVEFTERILAMSGKEYRRVFAESPLARPGRKAMLRNLCVALANYGATSDEAAERVRPVLERAAEDGSELVREHAWWGLAGSL